MDRLSQLAADLSAVLEQLHDEAGRRELSDLNAPLSWLTEANRWLHYEVDRANSDDRERDPVPFTFIPAELRR